MKCFVLLELVASLFGACGDTVPCCTYTLMAASCTDVCCHKPARAGTSTRYSFVPPAGIGTSVNVPLKKLSSPSSCKRVALTDDEMENGSTAEISAVARTAR